VNAIATLDREAVVEAWDSILRYVSKKEDEALKQRRRKSLSGEESSSVGTPRSARKTTSEPNEEDQKSLARVPSFSYSLGAEERRDLLNGVVEELFSA
jgi:hypothetical protein